MQKESCKNTELKRWIIYFYWIFYASTRVVKITELQFKVEYWRYSTHSAQPYWLVIPLSEWIALPVLQMAIVCTIWCRCCHRSLKLLMMLVMYCTGRWLDVDSDLSTERPQQRLTSSSINAGDQSASNSLDLTGRHTLKQLVGLLDTCKLHRIERSSIRCKFLVPETFKHSRPIPNRTILVTCIGAMQVSGTSFLGVCHRYNECCLAFLYQFMLVRK